MGAILNKQLTVENIETFAGEALEELNILTKDILEQYGTNEALEPANVALSTREQEDDAFKKLELLNIQDTLQRIIEVKDQISDLKIYLDQNIAGTEKVIIPPEEGASREIETGSGVGMEEKKFIPRLLTLFYILKNDFDIEKEDVTITEGKVAPDMMRRTPYVRVEIPGMERIVYICDEEGNASYIFDTEKLEEVGIKIEDLDISDKSAINDLVAKHSGLGARVIQTKNWRTDVSELLGNPIPEKVQKKGENAGQPVSEFKKREKKDFLSFEEFQREVKALYPREGDVQMWYKKERKNHTNWSASPDRMYKNKGWVGWPELVGKENRLKKEYLPFDEFKKEVASLYPGEENIHEWYMIEKENHDNWPSNPDKFYKEKGWEDWSELVGKENLRKKEFLPFDEFKKEVASLYPKKGDVSAWYRDERPNHNNWPYAPHATYKDRWEGWPELVEKENFLKKEFLSFEDFQIEVINLYTTQRATGPVVEWYRNEVRDGKHKNWPSSPDNYYKNSGWKSWPELVGKEKEKNKDFLPFGDFKNDVRRQYRLYKGELSDFDWYNKKEKKNHPDWPSNPDRYYRDSGWESWPELFGRKSKNEKELLSLVDLQAEVMSIYPGSGSVAKWYRKVKADHPNWPSNPNIFYNNKGWKSWRGLVEKGN